MRDIDEFPDEEPHIEDRGTKVKDYGEHSLTIEERDKIIREYNAELTNMYNIDSEEVHRLYYEKNLSQRKVAEALGVPRWVIQGIFKEQNWQPRPVGAVETDIDPQEVYRICVEEGRSKKEAAEILGCKTIRPINRILQANDWKTPLEVKMETEIDPDEVHRLHYDKGWSLKKIANHYGYESKDVIQRMFREQGWIPVGLARQIDRVFDFPLEIEQGHQMEASRVSDAFESLREKENISPLDVASCIESILSSSSLESRVKWLKIPIDTKVTDILENRRIEVEASLNELLDDLKDSKEKV